MIIDDLINLKGINWSFELNKKKWIDEEKNGKYENVANILVAR